MNNIYNIHVKTIKFKLYGIIRFIICCISCPKTFVWRSSAAVWRSSAAAWRSSASIWRSSASVWRSIAADWRSLFTICWFWFSNIAAWFLCMSRNETYALCCVFKQILEFCRSEFGILNLRPRFRRWGTSLGSSEWDSENIFYYIYIREDLFF